MKPSLPGVFWSFVKIGAVLIGGGYVMLPLLEDEIVKRRGWARSEEMMDLYALAQLLPGVIAVNTSMLVGNRLRGFAGNLAAAAGLTFVPFVLIAVYAVAYEQLQGVRLFEQLLNGMRPAVAGMVFAMGARMVQRSSRTHRAAVLAGVTVVASLLWNPSMVLLLLLAIALGVAYHAWTVARAVRGKGAACSS